MGKKTGTAAPVDAGFPRIVELINVDKIPKPSDSGPEAVLRMLSFRMSNPMDGLWCMGEHWNQWRKQWNIYDPTKPPMSLTILKSGRPLLEEQWARGLSELLLGTAYDGPDIESGLKIQDIYKSFCEGTQPFIAIACACQMLATYLVLSRGYVMSDVGNAGIDCDGNDGLKVFNSGKSDGHWDKGGPLRFAEAMKAAHPLQPGSCYSWIGRDAAGTKLLGSHVASFLRTDPQGGKEAQLLDTGAAQDSARPTPSCAPGWGVSGNYDNGGAQMVRFTITQATYGGLGTPASRTDGQLQAGIDRLKKTRPFGLARLFVATLPFSDKKLKTETLNNKSVKLPESMVFMSRLLRMWGSDETANYSIARCQYALRSLPDWKPPDSPGTEEEEAKTFRTLAWWVFFSPKGDLAVKLFSDPRTKSLADYENEGVALSFSSPLLVMRSLENGRTDWTFVRRALAPPIIGSIPVWMKDMLAAADPSTVYNPGQVKIPEVLNDKG